MVMICVKLRIIAIKLSQNVTCHLDPYSRLDFVLEFRPNLANKGLWS